MSGTEYRHRTAITRLRVDEAQAEALRETMESWLDGCNIAIESAWGRAKDARGVQSLSYDSIREETNLKSQHAILAAHRAAEAIRSVTAERASEWGEQRPKFTSPTVAYDSRTMSRLDETTVSLATTGDRIRCELVLPDEKDGFQQRYLSSEEWSLSESTLHERDDQFFLHLGFRRPHESRETTEHGTVLGVDLGIENLAVTSTAEFISGDSLTHRRREFERVREQLERVGTRSAHRTLNSLRGRERRHAVDVLHRIANRIVAESVEYNCDIIAFEELSNIRSSVTGGNRFHKWAFGRLIDYVEYKAAEEGIRTVRVSPEDTSRRCPECEHVSPDNRLDRDHFRCQHCGNRNHADYNAAKNIAERAVRLAQQSAGRTGVSRYALKSGTMTPSGQFTPHREVGGGVRG